MTKPTKFPAWSLSSSNISVLKLTNALNASNPSNLTTPTSMVRKIASNVILGENVSLQDFINLYGCRIGDNTKIGPFVEIQKGCIVGKNCKIQSHSFLCEGVTIEDEVFIGHGVMFINDLYPRSATESGALQTEADWKVVLTIIKRGASIGSNATILCGVTVGEGAIVGAGSVVTKDVPAHTIVAGNPARIIRRI
jgi:UDP-2-acetamido-3-amino-2,3-dideoxy-glucuronate N-acetyltransferase